MRQMKLMPDVPFNTSCDVKVYDITEGSEKKRCQIKIEYAASDIRQLIEKGMDYNAVIEYYKEWIYDVVKHYIIDDWECVEGMDKTVDIIEAHIAGYFEESGKK